MFANNPFLLIKYNFILTIYLKQRLTGTEAKLTLFLKRNVEPAGIYDTLWHSCQWTLGATLAQCEYIIKKVMIM